MTFLINIQIGKIFSKPSAPFGHLFTPLFIYSLIIVRDTGLGAGGPAWVGKRENGTFQHCI